MRTAIAALLVAAAGSAVAPAQPAPAPGAPQAPPDVAIARDEARAVALDLAARLAESYVFPDVAERYAAMLRGNVERGAYDGFTSGRALADGLTADLRAVSPDNHLRVGLRQPGAGPNPAGAGPAPAGARPRRPFAPIEETRWLAPGIAYIRFNMFPGDPETVAAVERFMIEHAEAHTLIIDARTHSGGGLAEMDAMFPYLFARPTVLVASDTRASAEEEMSDGADDLHLRRVSAAGAVVRHEHYVEPHPTEHRLQDAAVFVLTSGATVSAGEHLTLALKRTGRATIVGEPTAGAGHYGSVRPIGERFTAFIPIGRTFDPDTGDGWEGDGVAPDVAVPAAAALAEALVRTGLARPEADRIAAGVTPSRSMERRQARPAS
ncbi:MAG: hypothetical protein QOI38_202 [Sphingomonadales bacterium]|nr:hypothetical protein [Sphingomonadales bacterium]